MCISIIMRASYDSIDNKQKMCEKVNKNITFIQFFHSTELFKIFFSLLTLQLLFCKKLVGREKIDLSPADINKINDILGKLSNMKLTNYKSINQQSGQGIFTSLLIPLIGSMIPSLIGKGCKGYFF